MSPRRYTIVDVFSDRPLEGNPVAVFADGSGLSTELMQRTAREMNLSETVFVMPAASSDADARVRIFTPLAELPFAGHPVLGTAFVIAPASPGAVIRLETGLGVIPLQLQRADDAVVYGEMEQPIPVREPAVESERELLAALGLERSELPIEAYVNGPRHVYIALPDEGAVADLRPDMSALLRLGERSGFSCFAGSAGRFKTRMFAPGLGVPEDPATGSAAGPLGVHLVRHGRARYGEKLQIRQGAEVGRPSLLDVRVDGRDGTVERVVVGGAAVIVGRGEYRLE